MDDNQSATELSFLATLALDIESALGQVDASDTASNRRNALRTIISAMEGASWIYRTHVLSVAQGLNLASPKLEFAFAETFLFVSEQGEIREQQRFVSTTAMIRLTTKTAQEICSDLEVDFMHAGWQKLQNAIRLRNRITHPKGINDLAVSRQDMEAAKSGVDWFLTTVITVMEATVRELSAYSAEAKDFIAKLRSGDPDTLALYERVRRAPDD